MRVKVEMDDDEKGKLFVGGLSWETTQENLQRYFSRYGEVIDCVVMKNSESGRSRGFGFVTFSDPANVGLVLQNGPHQLDGRTIDPKPCNPRTLQKPKRSGGFPKVFLGGLPSNVTETDLRQFFARFGKVMEVVIMYDQEKKKSRGFGFLSFEDEDAVDRCVSEHFVNLAGKQVEIKRAEPRDSSSKMNDSHQGQWGPPQQGGPPMGMAGNMGPMGGPNGQMGGPMMGGPMGPPGNMMQQYQGWGTSPQTGGYAGYSAQYNAQGWGAPPGPPQQQQIPPPPPHQWGNNYSVQPAAATQGYGSYGGSSLSSVIAIGSKPTKPWDKPYFDDITQKNITAIVGQKAVLSCHVKHPGNRTISWMRMRDMHILTSSTITYTGDARFSVKHPEGSDEWRLTINFVQPRDAGLYECQVNTEPKMKLAFELRVEAAQAKIVGPEDVYVKKGSTISLTCTVNVQSTPPSSVAWHHGASVVDFDSPSVHHRGGVSLETEKTEAGTTSKLLVTQARSSDSGNYTCIPSNANSASVMVHVLNGEHPAAMQHGGSCGVAPTILLATLTLLVANLLR
ncbi:uncharacterized protein LOC135163575 isoform X3 [Diachasmimorpha longicaudata]|uniref:uncharacterized protein LOC135163575 isoform X3 n=1 Tax=Diachasmimorpha longicaudata TaxID=58733 RepID=UPI0030B908D3